MSHKTKRTLLWIAAAAGVVLLVLIIIIPRLGTFALGRKTGQMQINVMDGDNNQPIAGAVIVIPEARIEAVTDETGNTALLTLPVLRDTRFDKSLSHTWGEVTLLVYKDGYAPYILVDAQVFENQLRDGPIVYLFRDTGSNTPYAIVEGPDRRWVDEILEKFRPAPAEATPSEAIPPASETP